MHNFTDLRTKVAGLTDPKAAIVALLSGIASQANTCATNQGAVEAFARDLGASADGLADAVLAGTTAPLPASDPKVADTEELRTDGPTLEEYRAAGYRGPYPPRGYAAWPPGTEAPALPEPADEVQESGDQQQEQQQQGEGVA